MPNLNPKTDVKKKVLSLWQPKKPIWFVILAPTFLGRKMPKRSPSSFPWIHQFGGPWPPASLSPIWPLHPDVFFAELAEGQQKSSKIFQDKELKRKMPNIPKKRTQKNSCPGHRCFPLQFLGLQQFVLFQQFWPLGMQRTQFGAPWVSGGHFKRHVLHTASPKETLCVFFHAKYFILCQYVCVCIDIICVFAIHVYIIYTVCEMITCGYTKFWQLSQLQSVLMYFHLQFHAAERSSRTPEPTHLQKQ